MPLTPRRQKRVVTVLTEEVAIHRDGPFSTAPPLQESSSQASLDSLSLSSSSIQQAQMNRAKATHKATKEGIVVPSSNMNGKPTSARSILVDVQQSPTLPTVKVFRQQQSRRDQKLPKWVRRASIALVLLYINNLHLLRLASNSYDDIPTNDIPILDSSNSTANSNNSTQFQLQEAVEIIYPPTTVNIGCLFVVFYTYVTASILWNILIFSKRKRRRHTLISICLLAMINLKFNRKCCKQSSFTDISNNSNVDNQHNIIATKSDMNGSINVRISFSLHSPDEVPYPDIFSKHNYRCHGRPPLPPYLGQRTVLNFTTSIYTDLNIVFMGDSIGAQFAQAFDAASLGKHVEHRWAEGYRYLLDKDWVSECLTISSPIQGGGVSSFWRQTGLMSNMNKREVYLCNREHHNNNGWAVSQAITLLDHPTQKDVNIGAYDAFVMRVPHGWLSLDQITREAIVEQIQLANKYLGAKTVIISTLPLCNNVVNANQWALLGKINDMIHDIAHNWPISDDDDVNGIKTVLVQEFNNYTSQIIWNNAIHIGMTNRTLPDTTKKGWEQEADFFFDRLNNGGKWPPSKAQVCVSSNRWIQHNAEQCNLNRISVDGSHWCVNSLGPRFTASIACLLGCVYNGERGKEMTDIRRCEQACNDQFMTINPVDEDWIERGTTLYASS